MRREEHGMWEEAKKRFPVGARVRGVVTHHKPFGIFVDLDDPVAVGLVEIINFLDEGRMTPGQYPPVGAAIEAVVLGHRDARSKQISLGMRPSQLSKEWNTASSPTSAVWGFFRLFLPHNST
jgi:ribosomal protein S1